MDVIEVLTQLVYLACALVSVRLWLRARTEQAAWSAATFGVLGGIVAITLVRGPDAEFEGVVLNLIVIAVLLVPWFLFRFAHSVVRAPAGLRWILDVVGIAAACSILLLPDGLAAPGETPTAAQNAWLMFILGTWVALAVVTTGLLWRSGRGQPGVTRGRLRLLAAGSLLLALSVSASGSSNSEDPQPLSQALSMAASITFLLGFAPPRLLRSAWRAPEERALHEAAVGLLAVTDLDQIGNTLAPSIRALLGSPGLVAKDEHGRIVSRDGVAFEQDDPAVGAAEVGPIRVRYVQSTAMPMFGAGEEELLDRLSLLASLASERVRFIDSEREARQLAEQATDALGHANKDLAALNEELKAFVYTASHDLRNPIIAMLGYVEVLQEDYADSLPEDARHYLERMQVNAEFMQALIRDLLELSRVGRVDTEATNVRLDVVVDTIGYEADRRHPELELDVRWLSGPQAILANAGRTRQLFENLIENACRYAGRTDVEVTFEVNDDPNGRTIDVRDNGAGIPEGQLNRVFGMFERLHPDESSGTGMGLAICRRIAESLKGTICALPCDDGAHIRIQFPASVIASPESVVDTGDATSKLAPEPVRSTP